jgi:hypothetical protein
VKRSLLNGADAANLLGGGVRAPQKRCGGVADAGVLEHRALGPPAFAGGIQLLNNNPAEAEGVLLEGLDLLLKCGLGDHAPMVPRPTGPRGIERVHRR